MIQRQTAVNISKLLEALREFSSSPKVANPYSREDASNNLNAYLEGLIQLPYSGDLFVGEAPGWAGCALTGIPFTSEAIIRKRSHPFLANISPRLHVAGAQTEPSATIVWDYLSCVSALPAFWNIFPFHPHERNCPRTNRPPTQKEIDIGTDILRLLVEILNPRRIFAIGRKPERVISSHHQEIYCGYIRHPAHGGKNKFINGMKGVRI